MMDLSAISRAIDALNDLSVYYTNALVRVENNYNDMVE
jgi:hypothetical protein